MFAGITRTTSNGRPLRSLTTPEWQGYNEFTGKDSDFPLTDRGDPVTTALRLAPLLAVLAISVPTTASAGPIANLWNRVFYPGYYYSPAPAYYTGYGYSGYGYTTGYGYAGCGSCGGGYGVVAYGGCGSACGSCDSCGSCGSCGNGCCGSSCGGYGPCASCGSTGCGGNCVASAPNTKPEPDNPPRRTFEDGDEGYNDPSDGGFGPRESGSGDAEGDDPGPFERPEAGGESREALKPNAEESTIPKKKEAPTPEPKGDAAPAAPEVDALNLDDRIVWTAQPRPERVRVRARYGTPTIARTRIDPAIDPTTVHVSTRVARK